MAPARIPFEHAEHAPPAEAGLMSLAKFVDGRFDVDVIRSRRRWTIDKAGLVAASVLLAIDRAPDGDRVLLTRRAGSLHDHPGEVCLPGGKRQAGDDGPVATALREALEEVGLYPQNAEQIACLDDVTVGTKFVVTPVVAIIRRRPLLRLDGAEVDEALWIEARELRSAAAAASWTDKDGIKRFSFTASDWSIQGATARILYQALNPARGCGVAGPACQLADRVAGVGH